MHEEDELLAAALRECIGHGWQFAEEHPLQGEIIDS